MYVDITSLPLTEEYIYAIVLGWPIMAVFYFLKGLKPTVFPQEKQFVKYCGHAKK